MARHVILLGGDEPVRREFEASATVTPGMLCKLVSATTAGPDATDDNEAPRKWFADLDPYVDAAANPTTANIDIDYNSGDTVYILACDGGERIQALLAAGAAAVAVNDPLCSAGDGTLRKFVIGTDTGRIVAFADEAVDNSGGASVARIAVEVA